MHIVDDMKKWLVKVILKRTRASWFTLKEFYKPFMYESKSGPKIKVCGDNSNSRLLVLYDLKNCSVWTNCSKSGSAFQVNGPFSPCMLVLEREDLYSGYYYRPPFKIDESERIVWSSDPFWRRTFKLKLSDEYLEIAMPYTDKGDLSKYPLWALTFAIDNNCTLTLVVNHTEEYPEILYFVGEKFSRKYNPVLSVLSDLYGFGVKSGLLAHAYTSDTVPNGISRLVKLFNSSTWTKNAGTLKWNRCMGMYRHWAVPKSSKKGWRLISAPTGELKKIAASVHSDLSDALYSGGQDYSRTLSYIKGVDYVSRIADMNFSVERVGKWCLQVDLKDFFTNITPELIGELDGAADGESPFTDRFLELLSPLVGHARIFAKGYRYAAPRSETVAELCRLAMTVLPLWRRDLHDYDFLKNEYVPDGCRKALNKVKGAAFGKIDFAKVIKVHGEKFPYLSVTQCGVPQGASFSGDIANVVAKTVADILVRRVKGLLSDYGCDPGKMDWLAYSDNIYIFYDLPDDILRSLPEPLVNTFRREFREDRWLRKILVPWKIINVDRDRQDVKLLGILLDRDGNVRLSRRYRRKVNQAILHAGRGLKAWTSKDEGMRQWFVHVRKYMKGSYSRELLNLNKEG